MHQRNSIVNAPLLVGLVLSIALHVAALCGKGIHTPPKPALEQGRTVVRLTLIPSVALKGNPSKGDIDVAPAPTPVPQAARLPGPVPVPNPTPAPTRTGDMHVAPTTPLPKNSTDQDASLIEEKGVTTDAQSIEGIRATYPRISQRRGEEGTVLLSIEVLASGRAGKIEIIESCGYRRLDEAALKAAKQTRYTPATRWNHPVDSTLIQPLVFELTNHD